MKEKKVNPAPCVKCAKGGTGKCLGVSCRPFNDWIRHRRRAAGGGGK